MDPPRFVSLTQETVDEPTGFRSLTKEECVEHAQQHNFSVQDGKFCVSRDPMENDRQHPRGRRRRRSVHRRNQFVLDGTAEIPMAMPVPSAPPAPGHGDGSHGGGGGGGGDHGHGHKLQPSWSFVKPRKPARPKPTGALGDLIAVLERLVSKRMLRKSRLDVVAIAKSLGVGVEMQRRSHLKWRKDVQYWKPCASFRLVHGFAVFSTSHRKGPFGTTKKIALANQREHPASLSAADGGYFEAEIACVAGKKGGRDRVLLRTTSAKLFRRIDETFAAFTSDTIVEDYLALLREEALEKGKGKHGGHHKGKHAIHAHQKAHGVGSFFGELLETVGEAFKGAGELREAIEKCAEAAAEHAEKAAEGAEKAAEGAEAAGKAAEHADKLGNILSTAGHAMPLVGGIVKIVAEVAEVIHQASINAEEAKALEEYLDTLERTVVCVVRKITAVMAKAAANTSKGAADQAEWAVEEAAAVRNLLGLVGEADDLLAPFAVADPKWRWLFAVSETFDDQIDRLRQKMNQYVSLLTHSAVERVGATVEDGHNQMQQQLSQLQAQLAALTTGLANVATSRAADTAHESDVAAELARMKLENQRLRASSRDELERVKRENERLRSSAFAAAKRASIAKPAPPPSAPPPPAASGFERRRSAAASTKASPPRDRDPDATTGPERTARRSWPVRSPSKRKKGHGRQRSVMSEMVVAAAARSAGRTQRSPGRKKSRDLSQGKALNAAALRAMMVGADSDDEPEWFSCKTSNMDNIWQNNARAEPEI